MLSLKIRRQDGGGRRGKGGGGGGADRPTIRENGFLSVEKCIEDVLSQNLLTLSPNINVLGALTASAAGW